MVLRIGEDIPTTLIELHVQSTGVAKEEQIFYTEYDDETEEQTWQWKQMAGKHPTNRPPDILFEKYTVHKSDKLSTFQQLSNINSFAIEQNNNIILQQLRLEILKEDYSETFLLQDNRYHRYSRQFD